MDGTALRVQLQPCKLLWLMCNRSRNNIRLPMVVWYVHRLRTLAHDHNTNDIRLSLTTSSSTRSVLCEARR